MRVVLAILFISLNFLYIEGANRTESADDGGGGDSVASSIDSVLKFKSEKSENVSGNEVRGTKRGDVQPDYEYGDVDEETGENVIDKKNNEKGEDGEGSRGPDVKFPNEVFLSLRNLSGSESPVFRGFTHRNDIEDLQASASDNVNVTANDTQGSEDSSTGTLRSLRDAGYPPIEISAEEAYPPLHKPPNTIDNADFSDCARQGEWKPIGADGRPLDLDDGSAHLLSHHGFGGGGHHHHNHHHHAQLESAGDLLQSVGSFPVANKVIPHWHDSSLSHTDNQLPLEPVSDVSYGVPGFGSIGGGGHGGGHGGSLEGSLGGGIGGTVGGGHGGGGGFSGLGSGVGVHSGGSLSSAESFQKIKSSNMLSPPPLPPVIFGKKPGPWKSYKPKHKFHHDKRKRPGNGFSSFNFGGNGGGGFGSFGSSSGHYGGSFSSGHIKKPGGGGFGGGGSSGGSAFPGHFKYGSGGFSGGSGLHSGHVKFGSGGFGGGGPVFSKPLKQGKGGFGGGGFGGGASGFTSHLKPGGGIYGGGSGGSGGGLGGGTSVFTGHLKDGSFDGSTSILTGHIKEGNGISVFDGHIKHGNGGFDGNGVAVFTGHIKEENGGNGGGGNSGGDAQFFSGSLNDGGGYGGGNGGFSTHYAQGNGGFDHLNLGGGSGSVSTTSSYSDHSSHDGGSSGSFLQSDIGAGGSGGYYHSGGESSLGHVHISSSGGEAGVAVGVGLGEDSSGYPHHEGGGTLASNILSFDNGAGGFGGHVSSETHFADAGGLATTFNGNNVADVSFEAGGTGHSADQGYIHEDSATGDSHSVAVPDGGSVSSSSVTFDEGIGDNSVGHSAPAAVLHYEGGAGGSSIVSSHENDAAGSVVATVSSGGDGGAIQGSSDGFIHQGLTTTTNIINQGGDSGGGNGNAGSLAFHGGDLLFGSTVLLGSPHAEIATGDLHAPHGASANLVATVSPTGFGNGGDNILTAPSVGTLDHLGGGGAVGGETVGANGAVLDGGLSHASYLVPPLSSGEPNLGSLVPDSAFLSTQINQATREGNSLSDSSFHSHSSQEYPGFVLQAHGVLDDSSTFTCGKNHYHNTKYHTATFQVADNDHPSSVDIIKYDGDAAVIVRADSAPFNNDIHPKRKHYNWVDGIPSESSNSLQESSKSEHGAIVGETHHDSSIASSQYNLYNRKPQTFSQEPDASHEESESGQHSGNKIVVSSPKPPFIDGSQASSDSISFKPPFREGFKKPHGKYPLRPGKVQFYQKNLKNLKPPLHYASGLQGGRDTRGERLVSIGDVVPPIPIPLKQYQNQKTQFPRPRNQPKMIGGPIVVRRPDKNSPKIVRVVRS